MVRCHFLPEQNILTPLYSFIFLMFLRDICYFILLLKEKKRSKLTFTNISGETKEWGGAAQWERDRQEGAAVSAEKVTL